MHMGLENMGGPAVGFLDSLPAKTVTYGAVMTHDDRTGEMTGFKYGAAVGGEHGAHGAMPARPDTGMQHMMHDTMPGMTHEKMPESKRTSKPAPTKAPKPKSPAKPAEPHTGHEMPMPM